MKLKNIVLGIVLLLSCTTFAQEKGEFSAYAGVTYPLYAGAELGANVGVEYLITDEIAIAPSFSYYFYDSGFTTYSINVDGRYYLGGSDSLKYFGLLGVSRRTASFTAPIIGTITASNIGFNAGGGLIYMMGESFGILAQVKYGTAGTGGIEPMVGISISM